MTSRARRRSRSLRWRLTGLAVALVAVALAAGAVALTGVVSASRVGALDEIASRHAVVVARLVETGQLPDAVPASEPGEIAQVLTPAGAVIATSANASRTLPVVTGTEIASRLPTGSGRDEPTTWTTESTPYGDSARVAALRVVDTQGVPVVVTVAVPLDDLDGVVRALQVSLWGIVPVLTLGVGVVVWTTTGRALRPVEELRAAAQEIAATGTGTLPDPARDDEIGALAHTLDDMLDRLRAAADRQRSFVADAAHELRSPVATLRASIDVAARYPDAYTAAELVEQTSAQVARLQRLVDDLLVLARLGARPAATDVVDLRAVALAVVEGEEAGATRPAPEARQVRVTVVGEGTAVGEEDAVGRIVRNLVANARRHAASRVRVTVADGSVVVEDDGPGIAREDRDRVFERFTRLDAARDREDGGSGLGLAIARESAEHLGGDVALDESEGGGLRAGLELPRVPPSAR